MDWRNMYRENGRKSIIPKTPSSRRNDDAFPRPSFSVQRQRIADTRFSLASGAIGRMSMIGGQPRPSMAVGVLSGRGSMLAVPNSTNRRCLQIPGPAAPKDTRPVSDRTRQAEMIRRIFEYLSARDVPFTFTEKMIRLPNNKNEFKQMFEFILREVDDDYKVGKLEEEVPKIMSAFGYPTQIKQSTMATITAQHCWPSLLAVLDWLITEVIQVSIGDESFIEEDMQLPYSYFTTCYLKKRTEAQPDYSSELEKLKQLLNGNAGGRSVEDSFREHYNKRIENEKELKRLQDEIEQENAKITELDNRIRIFCQDIVKMKQHHHDQQVSHVRQDEVNKEHEILLQKMIDALAGLNEQIVKKEKQIACQKISADEVRAIHTKSKKLKTSLAIAREECRVAEEKVDELQPLVFKKTTLIQTEYKKFFISLQDLCEKFLPREQFETIDWLLYDYDHVWAEFQRDSKSVLTKLIDQLKSGMETMIAQHREKKQQYELVIEEVNREIRDINNRSLQADQEHKLMVERITRQAGNVEEQIRRAKIERGLVQDKHRRAKTEYETIRDRCMEASERLANVEQLYTSQRNDLERNFNDLLAAITEKITQLYVKIEQINEQKENWQKLGMEVYERSRCEIEELRLKKRACVGTDLTNQSRLHNESVV